MTKNSLSKISLEDLPGLIELQSTNLFRNIKLLKGVQIFINRHFEEFMEIRKQTIPEIKFSAQEQNEIKKWFNPKTTREEVKDHIYDLAIKISQINREETDIPKFIREMSLTYL